MVVKQFRAGTPDDALPFITIGGGQNDYPSEDISNALLSLCITYGLHKGAVEGTCYERWRFHTDRVNFGKARRLLRRAGYTEEE